MFERFRNKKPVDEAGESDREYARAIARGEGVLHVLDDDGFEELADYPRRSDDPTWGLSELARRSHEARVEFDSAQEEGDGNSVA